MTTSSGKPPLDEDLDVKRDAEPSRSPAGAPASLEASSTEGTSSGGVTQAPIPQQLYGTVVPYGGDDRTEEIEPIELDMPFASDSGQRGGTAPGLAPAGPVASTAPARRAPARPPAPAPPFAAPKRDFEMPVAQLLVSDLFDSSPPPSGALEPPDLAAFSTHPPPPPNGVVEAARPAAPASKPAWPGLRPMTGSAPPAPPVAARATPAATPRPPVVAPFGATEIAATPSADEEAITVVAMPSIEIGVPLPVEQPSQRRSSRPPAAPGNVPAGAADAPPRSNLAEPEALGSDGGEERGEDRQRRSVPTLESVGNAASQRAAAEQSSEKVVAGSDGAALPALPAASDYAGSARFPSEIPTSRPPDVMRAPDSQSTRRAPARAVASGITAPAPVNVAQTSLPSIMLAPEVEAETVGANRRAQRAARATVRLELPPDFGRPGSPVAPGVPAVPAPRPLQAALPNVVAPQSLLSKYGAWIAAALLVLACLVVLLLAPSTASLVVNALGPGQRAVEGLQIFVDGEPLACEASPCEIAGLSAGEHKLRATAHGLSSGEDQIVAVEGGTEAILNLELVSTEPERHSGGLRVVATDPPRTLYVDGTRVGKLPREVSGLAAGKHWLKFDAEDGSPPIEKSVTVLPGQIIDVEATAAKRSKALVTILLSRGSEGASVTLDEAFLLDFPAELELEPGSSHTLTATKPGFEDYMLEIQAEAGGSEKTIEVELSPLTPTPAARPKAKTARKAAAAQKAQSADATQGLLNISSVPPSQIILNGRPLGSTPKTAVAVPGDTLQTIVFVHPKMGRRRAQKFVPAGKERTVAIRF